MRRPAPTPAARILALVAGLCTAFLVGVATPADAMAPAAAPTSAPAAAPADATVRADATAPADATVRADATARADAPATPPSTSSFPTALAPTTLPADGARANVLRLSATDAATLQRRVDAELAARPGGRQISQYEISYDGGAVVLALPAPGRHTAAPATRAAVGPAADTTNLRAGAVSPAAVDAVASGDSGSCPYSLTTKWYCWYTDANFEGARFQFSSDYCPGLTPSAVNFADWGRDNSATSWVNNRFSSIRVYDGVYGTGTLLWTEPRVSNNPNVGGALNDRATSAVTC